MAVPALARSWSLSGVSFFQISQTSSTDLKGIEARNLETAETATAAAFPGLAVTSAAVRAGTRRRVRPIPPDSHRLNFTEAYTG